LFYRILLVTLQPKKYMFKKHYFSVLLFALLLTGCKQKLEKEAEEPKRPLAKMEFPEGKSFDYGPYSEKVPIYHNFPVHNPGDVPLVIDSIKTACGCTTARGPKKPIMKGETDSIYVTYHGDGFSPGRFFKHVRIFSNAGDFVDLELRGEFTGSDE